MKLLIAGSRGIDKFDLEGYIPSDTECIISGGADGVDAIAEAYADAKGISKVIVRPQYDRYGKAAPLRRNEEMVDMADAVLVIWDGVSRGSKYTISYAKKKNKPTTVIMLCDHK
jgi:predicted Rossmann fold nucleotide-binding protein DprA/Smf involved in DNA uptake